MCVCVCVGFSSVWVSEAVLHLQLSLPRCIAAQSQIVSQIVGDSRLLAPGHWQQSEETGCSYAHL